MKRISFFLATALLAFPAILRAQDAATQERLNQLSAQVQDLQDAKDAQNRTIEELRRAIQALQQQVSKPSGNYANAEDVKILADKLQEIDRKRVEDNEMIAKELRALGRTLSTTAKAPASRPAAAPDAASGGSDRGYKYVVQQGDTLSVIVAAYRKENIKVTVDQILAANPGLDPNRMRIGQEIFIPAPK